MRLIKTRCRDWTWKYLGYINCTDDDTKVRGCVDPMCRRVKR